jgi:hypothetical protein
MNPTDRKPNGIAPDAFPETTAPRDRAAINRANAQNSTGPRTEAGKKRASLNALRHGLTGHTIVLPSEDLAAYQRHCQGFFDEYRPQGATETQLVQTLADTAWQLNRAHALESNLFALGIADHAGSIDASHPEAQAALAMAAAFLEHARAFNILSAHSQRLSRTFERTLNLLRETQAERSHNEKRDLERAADLAEMNQLENLPYDPAKDGFVFSNEQIEEFIQRRDRDERAQEASLYLFTARQ